MAFKNQKLSHSVGSCAVCLPKYETHLVNGVSIVDVVVTDGCSDSIPSPQDYTLQNLISAGIPLERVNAEILSSTPSNVEERINEIISSEDKNSSEENV